MPFRYVTEEDGAPIMPEVCTCTKEPQNCQANMAQGMMALIEKDGDKGIDDMF
jgi:hypothetical protein